MCPLTLLVGSGRDFPGVGQRTGDMHLTVDAHHGCADDSAEDTLQGIRRHQPGEGGYADVDLEEERKKEGKSEYRGNYFSPHTSTDCGEMTEKGSMFSDCV